MADSSHRERAGELLTLAGQAVWIEHGDSPPGTMWKDLSAEERAYWSYRAYPAVLAMVVATTPGDSILLGRLREFYNLWKRHGIHTRVREEAAVLATHRTTRWDTIDPLEGPDRRASDHHPTLFQEDQ